MLINDAQITGSLTVNASSSFQNIIVSGNILPDTTNVRNLGSVDKYFKEIYVSTGSINFVDSGSIQSTISSAPGGGIQIGSVVITTSSISFVDSTGSVTQNIAQSSSVGPISDYATSASFNSYTSSTDSVLSSLQTTSASVNISVSAINTFTSSTSARLNSIETVSSSNLSRLNSIETVSSSNLSRLSSLENKSGSLATTGSNTFYGTQTFSGSVYIANDLIVQGSSSIQYITGSSVNIGTNIVQLNTANPSVRFAGLTIIDSGSVGGSGSFLYDSVQDEFIFVHRGNGTNVTSSHFVLGPETYDSLGNETYLTNNRLPKGTGKEHLVDSQISDDGTTVSIGGALTVTGNITGPINATNGVVSGSSQITYASISSIPSGIVSGSTQVKSLLPAGTISGSSQVVSIANSQLANSTISGISLGSNLATLTIGTGLSGTSYNGSTAVTIANTITNNNQLTNGAGYITSAGTVAKVENTATGTNSVDLVYGNMADNDQFRIRIGGTASNAGFVEIATADDGTEPIFVRQYTGVFSSLTRTATLLDGSGNTSFPGNISAANLSGTNTGDQTNISGNAGTATTLVNNSSVTGMNFSGVFALAGSGASTGNSTGARLSESYGALWNMGNSATWHHQVINGSSLVGISAAGTNFGSGNIYASGDVTAYYSDMRLKTKISNIDNALDKVMKLNGFYYVNNDIAKEYGYTSDKVQIGVSAQEIEAVLPEIVTLAPFDITGDDEGNALSKSGEHYKTVKYDKIVPLLIEAIKEQQIKIDNLTIEVENLKKQRGI